MDTTNSRQRLFGTHRGARPAGPAAWLLAPCILFVASAAIAEEANSLPPAATIEIDFRQHIAPLLESRCVACHGADPESGLRLDRAGDALAGGYSGACIVPGDSAASRLIQLVASIDKDKLVMPPEGNERLTSDEIGLLRAWIDQGAAWPADLVLSSGEGRGRKTAGNHWSFQPIARPPLPDVVQADWPANAIDRFVLARLESERIAPAPMADRQTLIRRVTLDLIGLPPTPEEVRDFLDDTRPDAYEHLVDRLLDSPRYGERWAVPWLDLCHYADTEGYLQDKPRPVAWRYRAWLVDALNRDLPFDEFTVQQLAGDLLPEATVEEKLATGFLRNTLSNREGGADLEEFRVEQVVDRTMIVGTTWLGLTVGCARCHDHKYDPISQRDFYELYAFLDAADEVNIDAPLPGEQAPRDAAWPEYRRRRDELIAPYAEGIAELQPRWEAKLLESVATPGVDYVWDRQWEVLGLIWGQDLGEGQLEGTQIVLLDPAQRTQDQQDRLLDYFLTYGAIVDGARFDELKLGELRPQLEKLRAELPLVSRAPTMAQTRNPRQTYLHVRGDFRSRGIDVACDTPDWLPPLSTDGPPDRLALARWLVSDENPLTARVTVNRAWQEFFGRGLVASSDDFGTQGQPPTHPELLDWLASEFREDGWSLKRLHRLIVTSATYRQSSHARPELAARDPNNELLARQMGLRLTAEQVRDVSLAVGGLLCDRVGGPSVFPPQPESVVAEGFDNKWEVSQGDDRYRRGLYTFRQRLSPFAQGVTFDSPSLSRACSRRERSNTPLQALNLLNDPVFVEAARGMATRVLREAPPDTAARIERAYAIALARGPSPDEKARLMAYPDEQAALLRDDPAAAAALFGEAALFDKATPGIDPIEGAAWTGVCSVLLNLHEFITRD
jgi:hypothetical protein